MDVQNPIRILLAEDNPHDRRAFHRALRKSDLPTQTTDCKCAEAALDLLATDWAQFDLIVSDHNLPGASGLDLYQQMKGKQIRLPFILLTGVGNELLAVEALKLGVDDYLSKNAGQAYVEQVPTAISRVYQIYCEREADRRKDEFLATLAHELRNPLAPLQNGLEILRTGRAEQALVDKAVTAMQRQVDHMVHLVDDLLDLSRVTRGKITLRKQFVTLDKIVERALETSLPVIETRRHQLVVHLPDDDVWLHVDQVRIAQVLANLLNNAAKYTDQGGHIWLESEVEDGQLLIRVRDDGIGMTPQDEERVFEMFQQVQGSSARSQGGLGIGLTLVRRLAEMHGGSVSVHSDGVGKGSQFVVRLPVLEAAGPSKNVVASGEQSGGKLGQLRILVVDDNVDSAEMFSEILRLDGHELAVAYDGKTALEQATAMHPDVVFLDIGLPDMSGYEVAERIRQRVDSADTLIAAVTGFGQASDRQRAKNAGIDHHLVKPVEPEKIRQLLAKVCNRRSGVFCRCFAPSHSA